MARLTTGQMQLISSEMGLSSPESVDWIHCADTRELVRGSTYNHACFHVKDMVSNKLYVKGEYTYVSMIVWKINHEEGSELFAIGQCDKCGTIYWKDNSCMLLDIGHEFLDN